jgi:hypothetical protein
MSLAFVAGGVEYVRPDRSVFHAQWVRIDGVRSPVRVLDRDAGPRRSSLPTRAACGSARRSTGSCGSGRAGAGGRG